MRYLFDTNVISELRKPPGRVNPRVASWADNLAEGNVYISSISVFEIERGILLKQRTDPVQAERLRDWFNGQVKVQFKGRILPFDEDVASVAAAMHVPDRKRLRILLSLLPLKYIALSLRHGIPLALSRWALS